MLPTTTQDILLYQSPDGQIHLDVQLDHDTVWLTQTADGKDYLTTAYNLDVIILVGYRVKSPRGTSFRQWATKVLREYLVQVYALN